MVRHHGKQRVGKGGSRSCEPREQLASVSNIENENKREGNDIERIEASIEGPIQFKVGDALEPSIMSDTRGHNT